MLGRTLAAVAAVLGLSLAQAPTASAWQYVVDQEGRNVLVDTRFGSWTLVRFENGSDAAERICRYILGTLGKTSLAEIRACWFDHVSQALADAQNISLASAREIVDGGLAEGSIIPFPLDANVLAKVERESLTTRVAELEGRNRTLKGTVADQDRTIVVLRSDLELTKRGSEVLRGRVVGLTRLLGLEEAKSSAYFDIMERQARRVEDLAVKAVNQGRTIDELRRQLTALRGELKTAKASRYSAIAMLNGADAEIGDLTDALETERVAHGKTRGTFSGAQGDFRDFRTAAASAATEAERRERGLQRQLSAATILNDRLDGLLKTVRTVNEKTRGELDKVRSELTTTIAARDAALDRADIAEALVAGLRTVLENSEKELSAARTELANRDMGTLTFAAGSLLSGSLDNFGMSVGNMSNEKIASLFVMVVLAFLATMLLFVLNTWRVQRVLLPETETFETGVISHTVVVTGAKVERKGKRLFSTLYAIDPDTGEETRLDKLKKKLGERGRREDGGRGDSADDTGPAIREVESGGAAA